MKISKCFGFFLKDFFSAFGCLMVVVLMFLEVYSIKIVNTSLLGQIFLVSAAYTFFKFALVNKYEVGQKAQMISFYICFLLADIMIIIWLWFFSPSEIADTNLLIAYIIVVIIIKGLVYAMMYVDGHKQAKQLNEKLSEYRNGGRE